MPAEHSERMRLREKCLKLYADLISRHPDREIKAETINWLLWRSFPDLCQRLDVSTMSLEQAEPIIRDLLVQMAKPDIGSNRKPADTVEGYDTELPAGVEKQLRDSGIEPQPLRLIREVWNRDTTVIEELRIHVWSNPTDSAVKSTLRRANKALQDVQHARTLSQRDGRIFWE